MREKPTIFIDDDNVEHNQDAWVFLQLYDGDVGSPVGRTTHPRYMTRTPKCIAQFTRNEIAIDVSNSGTVMSDLVIVEYEIIYCSLKTHGVADGFTAVHAGEFSPDPLDKLATAASIPAGESVRMLLKVPPISGNWLQNLYFRARVCTLWAANPPKSDWDFATDPRVTEGFLRIANP